MQLTALQKSLQCQKNKSFVHKNFWPIYFVFAVSILLYSYVCWKLLFVLELFVTVFYFSWIHVGFFSEVLDYCVCKPCKVFFGKILILFDLIWPDIEIKKILLGSRFMLLFTILSQNCMAMTSSKRNHNLPQQLYSLLNFIAGDCFTKFQRNDWLDLRNFYNRSYACTFLR